MGYFWWSKFFFLLHLLFLVLIVIALFHCHILNLGLTAEYPTLDCCYGNKSVRGANEESFRYRTDRREPFKEKSYIERCNSYDTNWFERKTVGSLLSLYLECYNQFKVHLPCAAATFNLLLKIDSRSLIKTFICSQMVHALSLLDFIFRDLYEMSEGLDGWGRFLHSLEG